MLGASLIDAAAAKDGTWSTSCAGPRGARALGRGRHEYAKLPTATYETVKEQLRGQTLRRMLAEAESDPLNDGWLGDEMPDAARAVIGPD